MLDYLACIQIISIHALREEGDGGGKRAVALPVHFYPRPPRGGRHGHSSEEYGAHIISIHALREEGDVGIKLVNGFLPISIHALREEGDTNGLVAFATGYTFLSTPSARRATR